MQNDIKNELGTNFIEYAVACNTDRAIPNATDGLKPVAKRILWSSFENGRLYSKPHVKSARIVGEVMGAYHPHGDSSIYGAMVRLSQNWVMRYPLIDWHGSNGSISGDGPAHMRYTEARLSKISEDGLLAGIKQQNVNFIDNYDETCGEPIELPAIFPNLLCNPNSGIGVAIACQWPCNNLREVAAAINDYIEGKTPTLPGPDFPTGGIIINKNDLPDIVSSGRGTVKIRGKYEIDTKKRQIIFTEIPYGQTIEGILDSISKACDEKFIEGIDEIRDESNKKGLRIVIEYEKNVNPDALVDRLFLKTNLQSSFSYNQVALVDKVPTELGLEDCIKIYLKHNISCITKEFSFELEKAQARLEIVSGLLKALEDIDNIIALIKKSENSTKAKENLIEKYSFSEPQAKAIVSMRLGSLAALEKIELEQEKTDLDNKIEDYTNILANKNRQIEIIQKRLSVLVDKYGDNRRTEITQIDIVKEDKKKNEVPPQDCVIIITSNNNIKRIPSSNFKPQNKNTKGIKNKDDIIQFTCKTNTTDTLMAFSESGKLYRISVDKIPEGDNTSKGQPLNILLQTEEKLMCFSCLYNKTSAEYVFFITKNGIVKKTKMEDFLNIKRSGTIAIKLSENDSLAWSTFINNEQMIIITKNGMGLRIKTDDIPCQGRATKGVRGINLSEKDEVLMCLPVKHETDYLALFGKDGTSKKMLLEEVKQMTRGCKGITFSKKELAGAALVDDEDVILICGNQNNLCIYAKDITLQSRTAAGTATIKDNYILSITKV